MKYVGTSGAKGKGGVIVNVASVSQFGCEIRGDFWWERKKVVIVNVASMAGRCESVWV